MPLFFEEKNKGGAKEKMKDIERLMTIIGELLLTEVDEIDKVEYFKDCLTSFIIVLQSGDKYLLNLTETKQS